jgi:hypothetical protein
MIATLKSAAMAQLGHHPLKWMVLPFAAAHCREKFR